MALTDIMSVEMNGKYIDDSSSSSSVSSDSDDASSSSSSSSSGGSSSSSTSSLPKAMMGAAAKKKKRAPPPKTVRVALSDSDDDGDSDLDAAYGGRPPPPPPPPPPPTARKKSTAPAAAAAKKKKVPAPRAVAAPPPPPKPRAKAAASKKPAYVSSSSSGVSSDSSSSSYSSGSGDELSEVEEAKRKLEALKQAVEASMAAKAKVTAAAAPPPKKSRAGGSAGKKSGPGVGSGSLKVTLKLPPGFIANSAEANSTAAPGAAPGAKTKRAAASPAAKRQRTTAAPSSRKKPAAAAAAAASAAAVKAPTAASAAGTTTTKSSAKKPRPSAAATKKDTAKATETVVPSAVVAASAPPPPPPQGPAILSKLIPKGATVPRDEVRGAKELSLLGVKTASAQPAEVREADIPAEFNDPFAVETEALRNLDLFFFCDEHGNPISLEILDRPKEQRPRIMGFGTIVQHLPLAERPLPVKYVLPSPAFPSRSRKRPRSDNAPPSPRPPSASTSSTAGSRSTKTTTKRDKKKAKVSKEPSAIFQGDGALSGVDSNDERCDVWTPVASIFQQTTARSYASSKTAAAAVTCVTQLDGHSDSESGSSDLTSDDDDEPRSQSVAQSEDDSELLSTASSSSSDSESGNDDDDGDGGDGSNSSSSVSGSDAETGPDTEDSKARSERAVGTGKKSRPVHERAAPIRAEHHGEVKLRRTRRSKPKATSSNPAVNELMRTDDNFPIEPQGSEDELNLMECGFRHPASYKRLRVWLPEVTDWCLDYSDGDPTLWVITPHAWYKIAGPLSGLLPHAHYRETFKHVRMLFESSYLVAYVLKEWLPINKKVSYRATLEQICELSLKSRYRVTGWFLMENYHFILSQICNLFPDKDTYVESMFFRQLQRLSENHKSREARVRSELARRELRRAEREKERVERDKERSERKERLEDERKKWKHQRDEERKLKDEERKYPIEDLELLSDTDAAVNTLPVASGDLGGVTGDLLGELITAWQTICTFKDFVTLEPISLEALVHRMTTKCTEGTDIGVAQIFLAFLRAILAEKSFTSLMDDIVVEGNIKVSDLFVNCERTYGICERPYNDMLNIITWQDILRQLMSKDLGIDASIGHVEPLVGCEVVRQTLYMQTVSAPFNAPVDTTLRGLEDYAQIVKHPMDLGTIKQTLDSGGYEGTGGYERFATDVRLVWENATLYNGEESEIGRAALALSDIFEQDYRRFVVGRIQANDARVEGCKRATRDLRDRVDSQTQTSTSYIDIVHALYAFEYHELPISYKVGALSWLCSEFLKLDSIRTFIEAQVEKEISIIRDHRKQVADIESRRKIAERVRREKESAFRKDCISRGILPNAQATFSADMRATHSFIAKYYDEVHSVNEDGIYEDDKKTQGEGLARELRAIIIRELPLGRDRYHNSYWLFTNDTAQRLFIEKSDTGAFVLCRTQQELLTVFAWLNPKGNRELELLGKLTPLKEQLLATLAASAATSSGDETRWRGSANREVKVNLFPLPGGSVKPEFVTVKDDDERLSSHVIVQKMLLSLLSHVTRAGLLRDDWDASTHWSSHVQAAASFDAARALFLDLEAAVVASSTAVESVRPSWQRKRREWRLALDGACTYAQLVFLLHLLLDECINVDAFMDQYARLDRKDWLKLRAKECRNFIPDVGTTVVYFGDGHAQALKDDAKTKKKRFAQKSDPPRAHATLVCTVSKVSYHHGSGDPYALVVLTPQTDLARYTCVRAPGSLLCPPPSPQQRLSRILLRVVSKLRVHSDAGPFLEPVSDRDFPEYKEIVLTPMTLGTMANKAKVLAYADAASFLDDIKLICSNCELFCEGRFPVLPPLARNLVEMADALLKRASKEIRACEKLIASGGGSTASATTSPEKNAVTGATVAEAVIKHEGGKECGSESTRSVTEEAASKEAKTEMEAAPTKQEVVKQEAASSVAATMATPPLDATKPIAAILRLENRLPEFVVDMKRYEAAASRAWKCGEKFRILFRDPQGFPGEYYGGVAAGALPFDVNGLLPWEALRVTWDEDDGSDDSRINPWEAELVQTSKK